MEPEKVDSDGIEALIHIPEEHPAKAFCEEHGITIEQVSRRILKPAEVVKKILSGHIQPSKAVEERLQGIMKDGQWKIGEEND